MNLFSKEFYNKHFLFRAFLQSELRKPRYLGKTIFSYAFNDFGDFSASLSIHRLAHHTGDSGRLAFNSECKKERESIKNLRIPEKADTRAEMLGFILRLGASLAEWKSPAKGCLWRSSFHPDPRSATLPSQC